VRREERRAGTKADAGMPEESRVASLSGQVPGQKSRDKAVRPEAGPARELGSVASDLLEARLLVQIL